MTTYGYTNEDGEPIMDGAAYRYEQYLDSTYEPDPDSFYAGDDYEPEPCDGDDHTTTDAYKGHDGIWRCENCDEPVSDPDDQDDYQGGEDAWLDGSYEE